MSWTNTLPSARVRVMKVLDPVSQAAATVTTGWVAMGDFDTVLAVIQAGVLGAAATLDAKLQQAQDSGGTGVKDIAGKAITQMTKAFPDDNKQAEINCRSDELDVANGFAFVRLSVTVGVAASLISAVLLGLDARYPTVTQSATVKQVV